MYQDYERMTVQAMNGELTALCVLSTKVKIDPGCIGEVPWAEAVAPDGTISALDLTAWLLSNHGLLRARQIVRMACAACPQPVAPQQAQTPSFDALPTIPGVHSGGPISPTLPPER